MQTFIERLWPKPLLGHALATFILMEWNVHNVFLFHKFLVLLLLKSMFIVFVYIDSIGFASIFIWRQSSRFIRVPCRSEEPFRKRRNKRKYSSMYFFVCSFDYLFTFSIFILYFVDDFAFFSSSSFVRLIFMFVLRLWGETKFESISLWKRWEIFHRMHTA